jgi:hypothetical protein
LGGGEQSPPCRAMIYVFFIDAIYYFFSNQKQTKNGNVLFYQFRSILFF